MEFNAGMDALLFKYTDEEDQMSLDDSRPSTEEERLKMERLHEAIRQGRIRRRKMAKLRKKEARKQLGAVGSYPQPFPYAPFSEKAYEVSEGSRTLIFPPPANSPAISGWYSISKKLERARLWKIAREESRQGWSSLNSVREKQGGSRTEVPQGGREEKEDMYPRPGPSCTSSKEQQGGWKVPSLPWLPPQEPLIFPSSSRTPVEKNEGEMSSSYSRKRVRLDDSPPSVERKQKKVEHDKFFTLEHKEDYSSSSKRQLQVMIMGDAEGAPITKEEAEEIRQVLINKLYESARSGGEVELHFYNSGLTDCGWFLITCGDEATVNWLLSRSLSASYERKYTIIRAKDAPMPTRVFVSLRSDDVDLFKLKTLLASQNRRLKVSSWDYIETTGRKGDWKVFFNVRKSEVKTLEELDWRVWYELITLRVVRVSRTRRSSLGPESSKRSLEERK